MRILMITNYLPYPAVSGGRLRIYNLLKHVAAQHEVHLASLADTCETAESLQHLQQFCASIVTGAVDRSKLKKATRMMGYAVTGKPPDLSLLHSADLFQKIVDLTRRMHFDAVQIESVMGLYLDAVNDFEKKRRVFMFQNITAHQYASMVKLERRFYRRWRSSWNLVAMGRWEPKVAERFDRSTTVSENDRDLLVKANPKLNVDVVPNGVDVKELQPAPFDLQSPEPTLLFVGSMGYEPCDDAMLYFCRSILPNLQRVRSNIHLWIVGAEPSADVLKLRSEHIHVTGRVDSVAPYYAKSTVCIVPLRAGGGTRLKILEAMALGRPVVSTSVGCEGLDIVDGVHLLIGNTPEEFSAKVQMVLNDRELYQSLVLNGRRLVEEQYDWASIGDRLLQTYADASTGSPVR